ncbi:MAG: TetR/AcrR family transcriptional regulator [Candidatus Goldbacteria bacterium]|nr:TetR/AcrR family transcriptional regulator [Candidatus Goldiibacteriota bacterium]
MRNYIITKNKLIINIIDLMSKYGYNGISIRKITKKTNIKESTFYYYFKNKKSLLDLIINIANDVLQQKLVLKENKNGYLFLQNSIITLMKIFNDLNFLKIWRIINIESFNSDIFIKNKFITSKLYFKKYFKNIILILQSNNLIKNIDSEIIIEDLYNNIIALLNEFMELKLDEKNTIYIEEKLFQFINYFWNKIKK